MLDLIVVRAIFIVVLAVSAYALHPFGSQPLVAAAGGLVLGGCIIFFEIRLEQVSMKRLIGAAVGSILGIFGAFGMSLVLAPALNQPFIQVGILLWMTYCGMIVGAKKGDMLNLAALGGVFGGEKSSKKSFKILDTSVIIDGRIADIAETGFLDGVLVIPQFVLRELQLVADSADSMKRNRGRRGLDILQRIQKMAHLNVQIVEEDFPHVRDVDMKLIELAKVFDCKVITNDFNLNKVAQLHGVEVLNINELANSLKPIVLPGETMRVFILKEGKEYNQGVAYLDDGTMVVVDNAKKLISKTIDISVTSVLQTTAGKMIFGKYDERMHAAAGAEKHERPVRKSDPQPVTNLGPGENHDRIVEHMKVAVILPAAGLGTRMGKNSAEKAGTSRKQFMLLEGSPILLHTVRKFAASPRVSQIVVAVRLEDLQWVAELLAGEFPGPRVLVVTGGDSRQASVENALKLVEPGTDLVAVHDAVRPFIDLETIRTVFDEAADTGAAIVGVPAVDTVKQVIRGTSHVRIRATLPREKLVMAQTPQVFRYDLLVRAFQTARDDGFIGTDESSLVERMDVEVSVVAGSDRNIKITKPSDMDLANLFLREEMAKEARS